MKQQVDVSIAETKYIAAKYCATQAVWLHKILMSELQLQQDGPAKVFYNNKSTIALTKSLVFPWAQQTHCHQTPLHL